MSFGINGADPFKSYASNSEAGGSMGVYIKRRKKNDDEKDEKDKNSVMSDESDDDELEIDMDDDFIL